MYQFIKTVEFPNTKYRKFLPYAADSYARVEKNFRVNIGSLKSGFPIYSLLKFKENSQSVHLEL
jgi:hypothetical protein